MKHAHPREVETEENGSNPRTVLGFLYFQRNTHRGGGKHRAGLMKDTPGVNINLRIGNREERKLRTRTITSTTIRSARKRGKLRRQGELRYREGKKRKEGRQGRGESSQSLCFHPFLERNREEGRTL